MSRQVETLPRLAVTVAEAVEMTGISKDIIYRHIDEGNLIAMKPSRAYVIDVQDLRDFLDWLRNNEPATKAGV